MTSRSARISPATVTDHLTWVAGDQDRALAHAAHPLGLPGLGQDTRSTEVNRDLLYEPDKHLKRDAEFPPMRGKRV